MKITIVYPPWRNGDPIQEFADEIEGGFVGQPPGPILERIFRRWNRVDGDPNTEECVRREVRSMSVGDAVIFPDGSIHVCAPLGWKPITPNDLRVLCKLDAFDRHFLTA